MILLKIYLFINFFIFSWIVVRASPFGHHLIKNSHISRKTHNEEQELNEDTDYDAFQMTDERKSQIHESYGVRIKNVEDIYVCAADKACSMIDEYYISKRQTFDCHERNLAIFYSPLPKLNKTLAYLSKDKPMITTSQKVVKECLEVKR